MSPCLQMLSLQLLGPYFELYRDLVEMVLRFDLHHTTDAIWKNLAPIYIKDLRTYKGLWTTNLFVSRNQQSRARSFTILQIIQFDCSRGCVCRSYLYRS